MSVFGRPWVEAVCESALSIANKYEISISDFHCLYPLVTEETYLTWQFKREVRLRREGLKQDGIEIHEPGSVLQSKKSGEYLKSWAEIYGLGFSLLNDKLSREEQHIIYRELEVKLARAETNFFRGKKGGKKYNESLQKVITGVLKKIMSEQGKCSFSQLEKWLEENAYELETDDPGCDEVTFVSESGGRANQLEWINSKGETEHIAISSLKKYFTRAKKILGT